MENYTIADYKTMNHLAVELNEDGLIEADVLAAIQDATTEKIIELEAKANGCIKYTGEPCTELKPKEVHDYGTFRKSMKFDQCPHCEAWYNIKDI